jgi:hypothetical protein
MPTTCSAAVAENHLIHSKLLRAWSLLNEPISIPQNDTKAEFMQKPGDDVLVWIISDIGRVTPKIWLANVEK